MEDYRELPVDDCVEYLTLALFELLEGLKEAGFLFSAYRSSDRNSVMIVVDFSDGDGNIPEFPREKMKTTLVLVDTGMVNLPQKFPESEIIPYPDAEKKDPKKEEVFWRVSHFKNSSHTRVSFDYSILGGKIYVYKCCSGFPHLHSLVTIYSVQQLIEALYFFEEEDIEILKKQEEIHSRKKAIIKEKC